MPLTRTLMVTRPVASRQTCAARSKGQPFFPESLPLHTLHDGGQRRRAGGHIGKCEVTRGGAGANVCTRGAETAGRPCNASQSRGFSGTTFLVSCSSPRHRGRTPADQSAFPKLSMFGVGQLSITPHPQKLHPQTAPPNCTSKWVQCVGPV